jgi:hypothetical protein
VRQAVTNPFGYYQFTEVLTGENYLVSVDQKSYSFESQGLTLMGELTALNFVGQ